MKFSFFYLASTMFIHYSESEFLISSLENLGNARQDVRGSVKRRVTFIHDFKCVFVETDTGRRSRTSGVHKGAG